MNLHSAGSLWASASAAVPAAVLQHRGPVRDSACSAFAAAWACLAGLVAVPGVPARCFLVSVRLQALSSFQPVLACPGFP